MKNRLLALLIGLTGYCANASAQCSQACKNCTEKNKSNMVTNAQKNMQTASKPMVCKLTSPELRKRKEEVIAKMKQQILEKKELPDGYAYKFDGTDEVLDSLTAFIKSERLCCDFFNFKLLVSNDSFIWLEISGAEGAKEFIKTELEM